MQKPEHTKQEPWKQMSSRRKNQYIQRGSCSPRQHTGSPSPVRAGGARGLLCSEHKARGQVWRCWCPSRSHINDPETGPFAKPPAGVHKMNELRKKKSSPGSQEQEEWMNPQCYCLQATRIKQAISSPQQNTPFLPQASVQGKWRHLTVV